MYSNCFVSGGGVLCRVGALCPSNLVYISVIISFQAVEYFAEWALCPSNLVFLRVQTGVFDPLLIGDKAKWFSQGLQKIDFKVYDHNSSLGAAITSAMNTNTLSDENPTGTYADNIQNGRHAVHCGKVDFLQL